jgi:V/A-type H+-transporting ATPase subunit E
MEQGKVRKLKQKIIGDAEAEAAKIIQEARDQAKSILKEAEAEAAKIDSDFSARAEAEAKEHLRRQISLRELEARKAVLAEKGKIIEEVFEQVLEDLRRRDREGGYSMTRDLLLKAVEVGDEELILSREDSEAIGNSFLVGLNKQLKAMGKRGEITLSQETRDIKGGFVLVRGRREVNSSFETILSMIRDEVETEVSGILFGGTE